MKLIRLLQILALVILVVSCKKPVEKTYDFDKLSGYIQKGPFTTQTSVVINEMKNDLTQTGKTYSSLVNNKMGEFEYKNVSLSFPYVEVKADGYYFNEIQNIESKNRLILSAFSDVTEEGGLLNVNVLTTLEKERIKYLMATGIEFYMAKSQAQKEIMAVFEINKYDIAVSELLDISKPGDDNAILLAVSLILQGNMNAANLAGLLTDISTDMREDGFLNSNTLGSTLINNAKLIKMDNIRQNLEDKYNVLGKAIKLPDFEKYVNHFIENTDFEFTAYIKYPATGKYGLNILDKEKSDYPNGTYSMKAVLPENTSVKVKILSDNWAYRPFQDNTGWEPGKWNETEISRTFTSTRTGDIDFEIILMSYPDSSQTSTANIQVFENGDILPTWTKKLTINGISQIR